MQDKQNQLQQLQDAMKELDIQLGEGKLIPKEPGHTYSTTMYNVKAGHHHLLFLWI
jgi:hypothetical protein